MQQQQEEEPDEDFYPHYKSGSWWIGRTLFFTNFVRMLVGMKKALREKPGDVKNLGVEDTPKIPREEGCRRLASKLHETIRDKTQTEPLSQKIMFSVLMSCYKWEILLLMLLMTLESACRLGSSVVIQKLIQSLADGDKPSAYMFAGIEVALLLVAAACRNHAFTEACLLNARVRSSFVFLLYQRVSRCSQFVVRNTDMGKLINMLAGDFNTMEAKMTMLFASLTFPLTLLGAAAILVNRLGWIGLICMAVPLLILPLQSIIGKANATFQRQVNVFKDQRVKITGEVIEGIRFVKLYAWEIAFNKIIGKLRSAEVNKYIRIYLGQSFERALSNSTSIWAALSCFLAMHYTGVPLNSAKLFSTIEIMTYLKMSLFLAATGVSFMFELTVIFKRFVDIYTTQNIAMRKINESTKKPYEYIEVDEKQQSLHVLHDSASRYEELEVLTKTELKNGEVEFVNFNGYWSVKEFETPSLKNITLKVEQGKLYGIVGKVGSGKSGLLGAILQETPYYSGSLRVKGSIAYVEQEPYIVPGTVRNNILFGHEFDERFYNEVIKVCCLESDLKIFPSGDKTEIGERGITVSGGQKARISLARAVYSKADMYLFDDPISAVDAKVARRIYNNVIKGVLKGKTVLLVSHQVHYMSGSDKVIIMDNGAVSSIGTPIELAAELRRLVLAEEEGDHQKDHLHFLTLGQNQDAQGELPPESDGKLLTNEQQQKVEVTFKSYARYLVYSQRYWMLPVMFLLFLCAEACNTGFFRLLAYYDVIPTGVISLDYNNFWLTLGLIQVGYFLFQSLKYYMVNTVALRSNEKLHNDMILGLIRSPSSYFDTTPTGRLINRFSNDMSIMDSILAFTLIDTLEGPILSLILLINVFQILPYFIIAGVANVIFLAIWFMYCKTVIIQTKQLDLRMKSPVFSEFSLVTTGIVQNRIYGQLKRVTSQMSKTVNNSVRANYSFWFSSRVFGFLTSYVSVLVVAVSFFVGIEVIPTAGLYGVTIIFLLQMSDYLQWFLRQIINMESIMVSVERGFTISKLAPEAELRTEYDRSIGFGAEIDHERHERDEVALKSKNAWPANATIEFKNFSMSYRPGLPLVLNNINLFIEAGQKVGIVGRTGAGKSSIIQALFRMVAPEPGSQLLVGGSDAQQMGLHSLRRNLAIIPQTPFLFKGSIRQNIDPFEEYPEERLWEVLRESDLADFVSSLKEKLDTPLAGNSDVFSVGQKQLVCLSRAILRGSKILVLDEATSNVDLHTDDFIQRTLKSKFRDCTIVTIAHRLNTIADYDMVIVMEKGRVIESGTPLSLLTNSPSDAGITRHSTFAEMVKSTGAANSREIFRLAAKKATGLSPLKETTQ